MNIRIPATFRRFFENKYFYCSEPLQKWINHKFELKNKQLKQLKQLKQENEALKENLERTQNLYSKQYQINENKGYLKAEQKLEKIKEICNEIETDKAVEYILELIESEE